MDEQPSTDRQMRAPSARTPEARARRRQQLRRRRLVALGVLAAIVVVFILLVVLVARSCGGGTAGASAGKPAPKPTALRTPTAAAPLRFGSYGDSVGAGLLFNLKILTDNRKDIYVHRFVKVATGLSRPDFFDWPAFLTKDIDKRETPFEAVAIMLGANDGQDVKVNGKQVNFGTGSWKKMYGKRVGGVMDIYLERGVSRVYWVGMPRMGIGWFNKRMELMNGIYKAEAAKRAPRVEYIDAWTIVDAPAKTYQAKYRQSDKVHLSMEGGMKVAVAVLDVVSREWHMPPFK